MNARDISQPTADNALKKLKDGEENVKDTLKVTTLIYFFPI